MNVYSDFDSYRISGRIILWSILNHVWCRENEEHLHRDAVNWFLNLMFNVVQSLKSKMVYFSNDIFF